ncbi:hypothetical protein COW94_03305 [Candidatus Peregrinibacteria bacterium CG22_combo_CG10-13_8_21_14_all_44_10]|nr:MAG: hypothetical protein AUK45_03860 [Candidatus Peregrinibacteria bacterium CG2_30_44_17]PIP66142.1 MAG: hypothetical protein COW94_03305 [Candidatus Peregrinibacteria bacterium CG22_combo_CG10-13_8_21_14_all_44_10]PIS04208.1 MAG: hypothetical protein COT83_01845 [Candidatus Peregrinibacteria bacterium CG10_big_fil_rev_8_21_14_0_10_44_7]PIX79787.1 MAG: hypothetical protein COZ35_02880 [Candidatus Peregrinibacteria bacterium CG_4_10_14_3_um_filter_44_21]PJB88337.1 MAG: hypothetical protein 
MLTPLDLLYITIAIAIALLAIFGCITLIYLILILRDANKVVASAKDTAEKVNTYVMKPINAARSLSKHIGPIIKIVEEKIEERMEADRPKKNPRKK